MYLPNVVKPIISACWRILVIIVNRNLFWHVYSLHVEVTKVNPALAELWDSIYFTIVYHIYFKASLKYLGLPNLVPQKKPADYIAGILYALKAQFRLAEYNTITLTSCQAFFPRFY